MKGRANRRSWAIYWWPPTATKVQEYCASHDIPVMRTRRHPSGSDRLHEVMERTDADIYVNIQGDEPTVRADHIELLLRPLLAGESEVTTLKVAIDEAARAESQCRKSGDGQPLAARSIFRACRSHSTGMPQVQSIITSISVCTGTHGRHWLSFTAFRNRRWNWPRNSNSCDTWKTASLSKSWKHPTTRSASIPRRTWSRRPHY